MRLLVSVRSEDEAAAALRGGADIVDAKEPARGSLGPVSAGALAAIAARVPDTVPLSVALGDFSSAADVAAAIGRLDLPSRPAGLYIKLGFAGVVPERRVADLIMVAVESARLHSAHPAIIAVAYADWEEVRCPRPEAVLQSAESSGAAGLLVDTGRKDGGSLLHHIRLGRLTGLVDAARHAGLLSALAGSLDIRTAAHVAHARPDVLGFRGAACRGGRDGVVDPALVIRLRRAMETTAAAIRQIEPPAGISAGP